METTSEDSAAEQAKSDVAAARKAAYEKLPPERKAFSDAVDSMLPWVEKWMQAVPKGEQQDWLRTIHERYSEKFLNDNNKIWIIGSILIPASLAGLLALKDATLSVTIALAIGSSLLMWFWNEFADHHRAFQTKAEVVVKAIEIYSNLDTGALKLTTEPKKHNVRELRVILTRGVTLIWTFVLVAAIIQSLLCHYKHH